MTAKLSILLPIVALCFSLSGIAQDDIYVYGTVKDYETAKKLGDIQITIYKNGAKIQQVVTGANGKYEFNLDFGADYKMVYEGGGKVSKNILIDTRGIPEEERLGGFGMNVDMTLFKETPGLDVSILDQPIGKAKYQPGEGALSWDYEYTREIQDELRRLMREFEQKQKEQNKLEQEFADLVAAGDQAMAEGEFGRAVSKFSDALGIMPGDASVTAKLATARSKFDEMKASEQLEANFMAALSAGDDLFQKEDYEGAKTKYQEAGALKPADPQPKEKIALVDKKLAELAALAEAARKQKELDAKYQGIITAADNSFQGADYDAATLKYNEALGIKPEEQYPKDQLAAIQVKLEELAAKEEEERKKQELEAKYQSIISEADIAFKGENYEGAKTKYEEALGLMPEQQYPKDQIAAIAVKLGELAAAAEAERLAQEKQKQFDDLVDEGNALFTSAEYERSKSKFQDALGVLPDAQYPKDRIAEIDAKIAELAAAEAAAKDAEALQAQYDALMQEAESEFANEAYEKSISVFRDAHALKPDEQLPLDRIAEIERIVDELARKAEMDRLAMQEEEERRAAYDKMIVEADGLFDQKDYEPAKIKYQDASQVISSEQYPKDKIAEIEQILNDLAAQAEADRLEAERLAAEKAAADAEALAKEQAIAAQREAYDKAIAAADASFNAEEYQGAKSNYEEALGIFPDQPYPKSRLDEIEQILKDRALANAEEDRLAAERRAAEEARLAELARLEEEARLKELQAQRALDQQKALDDRYSATILEADLALGQKELSEARSLYSQALDIKPGEVYPQNKIEQIDHLLALEALKKQEADRLAEERTKEEEEDRQRRARNTRIDRGKEEEAEKFMREARLQDEAEKYERIKKQKKALEDEDAALQASADVRREDVKKQFESYQTSSSELYVGSEEQRLKNAQEIETLKLAIQTLENDQQSTASQVRTNNYEAINNEKQAIQDTEARMKEVHNESISNVVRTKEEISEADQERIRKEQEKLLANKANIDQLEDEVSEKTLEKQQLAKDNQRIMENEKSRYQAENAAMKMKADAKRDDSMDELDRVELNKPKDYQDYARSKLALEYPEGVTEESYTEGNKVIIRRVVVTGNKADDYSKVIAKWGTYYFRNGQSITEQMWINDTTSADG